MDLGIFVQRDDIDRLVSDAHRVADDGFRTLWVPQIFGFDALTALAVVAREVPDLRFGTAVVPTYPRHPAMLAAQARTLSSVSDGRFTLGIGLSHQVVIEGMFGMSFDKPVRHMREYLDILVPLLAGEPVSATGEALTFRGALQVDAPPTPVLVAALGPAMLKLAGTRADGTVLWMTGPRTIRDHVAPTIRAAAEAAGRPGPTIVACLPVCVTDDPATATERAASEYAVYGTLPSYRAMMDRERVDGPAGIAVIGSADEVTTRLAEVDEAGATTVTAAAFGSRDEREATRELLVSLNGA